MREFELKDNSCMEVAFQLFHRAATKDKITVPSLQFYNYMRELARKSNPKPVVTESSEPSEDLDLKELTKISKSLEPFNDNSVAYKRLMKAL